MGTEEKEKPSPQQGKLTSMGLPRLGWTCVEPASEIRKCLGEEVEAVPGSSVPKGTEVTILTGTRTGGDDRREEKRKRQRWEKAEAGVLWHHMGRSPLESYPGAPFIH